MTLKEFITKYTGKYLDWDGAYGAQCVDLFRYYCKEVLEISQPKGVAGAKDFWTNYPTDPNLYNNFERIANTPDFVPQPGDVWIWTAKYGKYGHVAIESYGEATTSTFECFSQNDPSGSPCVLKVYKYVNVYGVLRPKNQRNIRDNSNTGQFGSDSSGLLESEDEMKTLEFLDCKNFDEAESKLIEHLGIKGDKCAWGTDDGNGTGGFLGSERRKVKKLEEQKKIDDNDYIELDKQARELNTQNADLKDKVQQQHKQIDVLDEKLVEKNKTVDSLQAQVNSLKAQLDGRTAACSEQYVKSLESQVEELNRQVADLTLQLKTKELETKKGVVSKLLQLLGL